LLRTERNPARLALRLVEGLRQRQNVISGWRRATHILCLGSAELDWMRRRFPSMSAKMSCYLHAPSDEDRVTLFEIRHARRRSAGEAIRFLWLGRWVAHKGPGELIRFARSRLKAADSLTIAGCGPLREPPAELASLGPRIRIVPHYSRQQLGVLLSEHDVGLFTSRVEGWGLSLQEMLESGMPVLATRTGGVVDLEPWFPQSLLPLWSESAADRTTEDPLTNGYLDRFSWRAIAETYEREALA
jgi:glycosyltransferase involved in cell wall biosynthesis